MLSNQVPGEISRTPKATVSVVQDPLHNANSHSNTSQGHLQNHNLRLPQDQSQEIHLNPVNCVQSFIPAGNHMNYVCCQCL